MGTGGGGGAAGRLALQLWDRRGAAPPTFDCRCRSFLFLFVFARELGSLPKKLWAKSGELLVLGTGLPWTPGDVPPPLQNRSRASDPNAPSLPAAVSEGA